MKKIIVTNQPQLLGVAIDDVEVMKPRDYLTNPDLLKQKNVRVFNLSDDYAYQAKGYYVSLLAEARGHKPIPTVKHLQDIKTPKIVRVMSSDLDSTIQKSLKNIKNQAFTLSIYFGKNLARQYDKLAAELHKLYQVPLLRASFAFKSDKWQLISIKPISFKEIPEDHITYVQEYATQYFSKKRFDEAKNVRYQYDLAILHNPEEKAPPSNKRALQKFIEAAERQGIYAELITKEDYNRIAEFNALLIRETTSVNHYTYKFASHANSEGLVVLDDPISILKCTNKVYLAELLEQAKLPTPKSFIIHADNKHEALKAIGLPCVLKLPDSSFSQGVVKAKTEEEYEKQVKNMLASSDLVLLQEFLPTDFDWRIGVLEGKVLYACKYFMAKGHWQIYNWENKKKNEVSGEFETLPINQVPDYVLKLALKACNLIGKGLYGVDIKESAGKAYIIEVNDNPNIDAGVEDQIAQDSLYDTIITYFKQQLSLAV